MTDAEFEAFLVSAMDELKAKQDVLEKQYGLGHARRWWFEQTTEKLQFFDESNRVTAEADVIAVGSYSPKSNTWKWAWSNDAVLPVLRQKAGKLTELKAVTGMELFGKADTFRVENESMAWELAAMSVRHLSALGCYRAPSSSGGPTTFLAITAIRKSAL